MSMSDKPKVTVLISTYNRPQYLAEAIESVVNQTFQDWELIVLNDGGVDVAEVVAKFADPRIIYVPDEVNKGAAKRFNQGLALARGDYVTYLGDDDVFYPNHVEVLATALDEHPEVALAYSDLYAASSISDRHSGQRYVLDKRISVSRSFNREFMFHFNHVLHVSLMHRLEAAKRIGGFDEDVKVLIEWSLNRRLCFYYDFLHVEVPTGEYHMAVLKSDRISVRERRDDESYKHNLRKIRSNFPPEPWDKVERVDMIYVVDEWGSKLTNHLKEIIDNFDHPFYIRLVNNGTGRTMKEIKDSLGNLMELKSISILSLKEKRHPLLAARAAAKQSNANYFFLVSPKLDSARHPKRLFATLDFMKNNPQHKAVRWDVPEEKDSNFDLLITRDYFMKSSQVGRSNVINIQSISINLAKGFAFDAMFGAFRNARKEKENVKARKVMDDILNLEVGAPHMQYLIHYFAPLLIDLKEYDTLEKELRDLIARGYRPDNLIRLGYLLTKMGRWPEAVDTLKEALVAHQLDDKSFEADCFPLNLPRNLAVFYLLMTMGDACLEINDLSQAAHYYHLAAKVKSNGYEPILGIAKVLFETGDYDRAEVALQKLPGRGGQDDPETQWMLGRICQKRKKLDLAYNCYKKAFELAPDNERLIDPFYFTGTSLSKWEEMYEPLAVFVHKNPKHLLALARLSAVCYQLKSDTLAEEMARRCLEMDPNNAMAKSILSRVLARIEKEKEEEAVNPSAVIEVGGLRLDLDSTPIVW